MISDLYFACVILEYNNLIPKLDKIHCISILLCIEILRDFFSILQGTGKGSEGCGQCWDEVMGEDPDSNRSLNN